MATIKTVSGKPLRDDFSDFEIRALKEAMDKNYPAKKLFIYGKSGEYFLVNENSQNKISIVRTNVGKVLNAYKVNYDDKTTETSSSEPQPTETKKVEPFELKSAETKTETKTEIIQTNKNQEEMNEQNFIENDPMALMQKAISLMSAKKETKVEIDYSVIQEMIDKSMEKAGIRETQIKINNLPSVSIKGKTHKEFNDILVAAKNRENIYLQGPAGTGKSHIAKQVAEALNLDFYFTGSVFMQYDLIGFRDAKGDYSETPLYKAMKNGGLFLFDEIDGSNPQALVAFNAILSDRKYTFPNGELVEAHKDFVVIATANTSGHGANESYTARYVMDASTKDRFGSFTIGYDKEIELLKCGNDNELVEFTHDFRRVIREQNLTYMCTPRFLSRFYQSVSTGMNEVKAMCFSLVNDISIEDCEMILPSLKKNKYTKTFESAISYKKEQLECL